MKHPVRARFAPSPTGHVHLGSARTALYDYLIARQTGGHFILRIEDTDRKRIVPGAEEELQNGLRWLGVDWDEGPDKGGPYGPYRQSERKDIYLKYAEQLVDQGDAYYCFCTTERLNQVRQEKQKNKQQPHYDGLCRNLSNSESAARIQDGVPHVVRFKSPKSGHTVVRDLIRGEIVVNNAMLDDFILVKSDGWALYHLAAIVDDYLMNVTHVIRGSEWLPTLPLHSLIWRAFGWKEPVWVHLSVFLKPSGKGKMSKREAAQLSQDGYSIFIKDFQGLGYLPEAVVNWIALMGWSFDDRVEFFTMEDLVEKFSLEKLNPSPAAINFSKLDHFNKLHIMNLSDEDLCQRLLPFFEKAGFKPQTGKLLAIIPAIRERLVTLDDSVAFCEFLFKDTILLEKSNLSIEGKSESEVGEIIHQVWLLLDNILDWTTETLQKTTEDFMDKYGLTPKQLYSVVREAISGQRVTPPLFESMVVLGREETLARLGQAMVILGAK
jgi:glutamyl-tRNA synthetase